MAHYSTGAHSAFWDEHGNTVELHVHLAKDWAEELEFSGRKAVLDFLCSSPALCLVAVLADAAEWSFNPYWGEIKLMARMRIQRSS